GLPTPKDSAITSGGRLSGLAMGGMIAGMSGVGTVKGRGEWRALAWRASVAVSTAVVVALLASRVNRPRQGMPPERRADVTDVILVDVTVDERSATSAAAS